MNKLNCREKIGNRRLYKTALCLSLVSFAFVCTSTADAAAECKTFYGLENNISREASEHIGVFPGSALKVCKSGRTKEESYYHISTPKKGLYGECRYTVSRVFKRPLEKGEHQVSFGVHPPEGQEELQAYEVFMMAADTCPRHDNPGYILVYDVSAGLFVRLERFWKKFSSTEKGMHEVAFSAQYSSVRKSEKYLRLQAEIEKASWCASKCKLTAVKLAEPDKNGHIDGINLIISVSGKTWILTVDLVGDDFVIVAVRDK